MRREFLETDLVEIETKLQFLVRQGFFRTLKQFFTESSISTVLLSLLYQIAYLLGT